MNCIWGYQHSSPCWIYRAWNRKSKYDSKATLNDACQNHDSLTMTYCTLLWTLKIMTNAKVIIWGQAQGSNGIHVLALQNHWNPLQSRKRRQSDYRYIYKKKKKKDYFAGLQFPHRYTIGPVIYLSPERNPWINCHNSSGSYAAWLHWRSRSKQTGGGWTLCDVFSEHAPFESRRHAKKQEVVTCKHCLEFTHRKIDFSVHYIWTNRSKYTSMTSP